MEPLPDRLKALNSNTDYKPALSERMDRKLLEAFDSPFSPKQEAVVSFTMDRDEFTSLCPVTNQPDYGSVDIVYRPNALCVESKSLKLYLMSFRDAAGFAESLSQRICDDLVDLLKPRSLRVSMRFAPRGGLAVAPSVVYEQPPGRGVL